MFVRLTALTMIASMAVNGFVPQRVNGSKDSLILVVGDAGRAAFALLCGGIRDPLAEIAHLIARDILARSAFPPEEGVAASSDELPVPVAADVAFTDSLSTLPSPADNVSFNSRFPVPFVPVAYLSDVCCRGSPDIISSIDSGRAIQVVYVLLLFMTCRWASSSGVLRRIYMIVKNPVFNEYRVFLFNIHITFPYASTAGFKIREGSLS